MSKHRRTREEKKIADQRHILYHLETNPAQIKPSIENSASNQRFNTPQQSVQIQTASYAYVTRDLRKTATITAAIIIAQIFLFIILNRV